MPEIALAKIREDAPFDKVCYIGIRGDDRHRRGDQHCESRAGRQCRRVRFGGIGLNVIQGARMAGASMIVGVDVDAAKKALAQKFVTHFVNSRDMPETELVSYGPDGYELSDRWEEAKMMKDMVRALWMRLENEDHTPATRAA